MQTIERCRFWREHLRLCQYRAGHGRTVYVYRFSRRVPGVGELAKYGAFHSGEVPYLLDNLKFVNRPWERADYQLAGTMSSYWANFARSGNPNGKGMAEWPRYELKSKMIM